MRSDEAMIRKAKQERRRRATRRAGALAHAMAAAMATGASAGGGSTLEERSALVDAVARDYRETATYTGLKHISAPVARALAEVPRHRFVPERYRDRAYDNRPLPIGSGQTISQPFIVALMTDLAEVSPGEQVLEIGTGSGYQAAVLAELGAEVWSIEIVERLANQARRTLEEVGYQVNVRHGDGNLGWPEAAPFDAILVTAAGPLPPALLEQLAPDGRLVMPYRPDPARAEVLAVIRHGADGAPDVTPLLPVRFVPLTGDVAEPP